MKFKILILFLFLNYLDIYSYNISLIIQTTYSENNKYYIKSYSKDFDDKSYKGRTIIKRTEDDSTLFEIDEFITNYTCLDNIFLSNDGKKFAYLTQKDKYGKFKQLQIYKQGVLFTQIDLICDNSKDTLSNKEFEYYNNLDIRVNKTNERTNFNCDGLRDSSLIKNRNFIYKINIDSALIIADMYPTFVHNDTLYIIDKYLQLIIIDLQNGSVERKDYLENYALIKSIAKSNKIEIEKFKINKIFNKIPDTNILGDTIAKIINMKYDNGTISKYTYSCLDIHGYIYKDGTFKVTEISKDPSLPEFNYKSIIESMKYNSTDVPDFAVRWNVHNRLYFRNINDSIAESEYEIREKKWEAIRLSNSIKDTLDGIYIPKDFYEAVSILDSNINDKEKEKFKKLKNVNEAYEYHFLSGNGLIYKWGLMNNSRLAKYFEEFGIYELDEYMAGLIKEAFWHYLNDLTFCITNFHENHFKLDSNLFVYLNLNSGYGDFHFSNCLSSIIKKDSLGKKAFVPPFIKSEKTDQITLKGDSTLDIFQMFHTDYSANDFIDSIFNYCDFNYDEELKISLDSAFFVDNYSDKLNKFLISFKNKLNPSDTNFYLEFKKKKLFYNVSESEIDSIDNIFCEINRNNRKLKPDVWSSAESIPKDKILVDFLKRKKVADLYIIKLYPYYKFNFKEYKTKANNIKNKK